MRITVIGANGMLGTDLVAVATRAGHDVLGLDLPQIDITDPANLAANLPAGDWVVNCAAYTQVDRAEEERDLAFRINGEGAGLLAAQAAANGSRIVQISTDYVFDGNKGAPYIEEDPPCPLNVYGESKLAGEKAVRAAAGRALVVRVESLYGKHGKNFVRTIATRLQDGQKEFRVVDDQVCSPSYTRHLSDGLLRLISRDCEGTVHMTAAGSCSWHAFARAIAERVQPDARMEAVPSTEYPTPAARPKMSVMDNSRFQQWTGGLLPTWGEGLAEYLQEEGWI